MNFKIRSIRIILVFVIVFGSCTINRYDRNPRLSSGRLFEKFDSLSIENKEIANRCLTTILDNEGLFTLFGDLKPISYVCLESKGRNWNKPMNTNYDTFKLVLNALSNDQIIFRYLNFKAIGSPKKDYLFCWVLNSDLVRKKIIENRTYFSS